MGLVNQVFNDEILNILNGHIATGHTRYSTTGSSVIQNAQPILIEKKQEVMVDGKKRKKNISLALSHNGNLVNTRELKIKCNDLGLSLNTTSDTEIMARLIHHEYTKSLDIEEALKKYLPTFKGAFAMVIQTSNELIAVRDDIGIRPLVAGYLGDKDDPDGWVVASETCAFDIIGAHLSFDLTPGTALIIDKNGPRNLQWRSKTAPEQLCAFEYIYFARPDSLFRGKLIHSIRQRMGEILARESPVDADIVVSVPDSGTPHAIGFARESGIPYTEGLIKNRYVGRTFISPVSRLRALGVRLKLNPLESVLRGQKVVLVDDSIVRGTTSKKIIQLLRNAGAKEVHFRVASPPVLNPCFYGIDTAVQEDLIASHFQNGNNDYSKLAEMLGADSLAYLSIEGMLEAFGHTDKELCLACLNGKYPIPISTQTQLSLNKFILEEEPHEKLEALEDSIS
jgi:amidophosphoribosyltransferase